MCGKCRPYRSRSVPRHVSEEMHSQTEWRQVQFVKATYRNFPEGWGEGVLAEVVCTWPVPRSKFESNWLICRVVGRYLFEQTSELMKFTALRLDCSLSGFN